MAKKNFTLLQTFCLRIVLKYRIEVSKALDLFTFISVNFGFILRKVKVVVVVDDDNSVKSPGGGGWGRGGNMIFVSIRQSNIPCRLASISSCNFKNHFRTVITRANLDIV